MGTLSPIILGLVAANGSISLYLEWINEEQDRRRLSSHTRVSNKRVVMAQIACTDRPLSNGPSRLSPRKKNCRLLTSHG
ncbi:hypothetical protein HDV64DRAFT_258695 [Trichoderma sp. TUCIM 5745]